MRKAVICDIDGTLANRITDRKPFEWDRVKEDSLIQAVADLLAMFTKNGVLVILFSGRDESCRNLTQEWLVENNIHYDDLFMRKAKDNRKDFIVKRELYEEHIKDNYDVWFVLDDRNQVVDMWRKELELPCFQVNYGDF